MTLSGYGELLNSRRSELTFNRSQWTHNLGNKIRLTSAEHGKVEIWPFRKLLPVRHNVHYKLSKGYSPSNIVTCSQTRYRYRFSPKALRKRDAAELFPISPYATRLKDAHEALS